MVLLLDTDTAAFARLARIRSSFATGSCTFLAGAEKLLLSA